MQITGTVTSVRRRRTDHGSMYVTIGIARPGTHNIRLTWLHGWEAVPARGQLVTVTGIPLMFRPARGIRSNISIDRVTVHSSPEQRGTP